MTSLDAQKFLILMKSNCFFFSFSAFKEFHKKYYCKNDMACLSLWSIWVNFYMWCEVQNPSSFFCLWIFSYSIKYIDILYWLYFINEKTILFPIEWSWCPWQKSIDHRCVGLFLGFTDLCLSLCQNYNCLFF